MELMSICIISYLGIRKIGIVKVLANFSYTKYVVDDKYMQVTHTIGFDNIGLTNCEIIKNLNDDNIDLYLYEIKENLGAENVCV